MLRRMAAVRGAGGLRSRLAASSASASAPLLQSRYTATTATTRRWTRVRRNVQWHTASGVRHVTTASASGVDGVGGVDGGGGVAGGVGGVAGGVAGGGGRDQALRGQGELPWDSHDGVIGDGESKIHQQLLTDLTHLVAVEDGDLVKRCAIEGNGSSSGTTVKQLQHLYQSWMHSRTQVEHCAHQQSRSGVFVNAELRMKALASIGFDYDLTLAKYTDFLQETLYTLVRDRLIDHSGFPAEIRNCTYDPSFAIRGLSFDTRNGHLLKVDYLWTLSEGNVYLGKQPLTREQILQCYPGFMVGRDQAEQLRHLSDTFCLPEVCLLADLVEFFRTSDIRFDAVALYEDVSAAFEWVHSSGVIHRHVASNIGQYLDPSPSMVKMLLRCREAGKHLFMLSNSNYSFIDAGMSWMTKDLLPQGISHWTELFDLIMVESRKPSFYTCTRPFRPVDTRTGRKRWVKAVTLTEGRVYADGSLSEFRRLTHLKGEDVLYLGDHVFADLVLGKKADRWRTGCVLRDLGREITIQNSPRYRMLLSETLILDNMIQSISLTTCPSPQLEAAAALLRERRSNVRNELKSMFNAYFGSVFRNFHSPSLFAYYLQRFANVYVTKLENLLLDHPLDATFYPQRQFLAHEQKLLNVTNT